jgi:hypothetical protein
MRKMILVTADFGDDEEQSGEELADFLTKLDLDHRVVAYDVEDAWEN